MNVKIIIFTFLIVFFNIEVKAKENLVADLSENNVKISTTFSGAEILLFGAYNGKKGDDIIIIVSGPRGKVKIDKKKKMFGIWMISESINFDNVPKYYYIASNKKIDQILNNEEKIKKGLDLRKLNITFSKTNINQNDKKNWTHALARNMIKKKFWQIDEELISINQNTLFRKTLSLPPNITTGTFDVKILHYRKGTLISEETSKINISKSGISANIFNIAQEYSALYGIFAVSLAAFFGWFTSFLFRKI